MAAVKIEQALSAMTLSVAGISSVGLTACAVALVSQELVIVDAQHFTNTARVGEQGTRDPQPLITEEARLVHFRNLLV